MKILVVEDERKLSGTIVAYLEGGGYLCEQAFYLAKPFPSRNPPLRLTTTCFPLTAVEATSG